MRKVQLLVSTLSVAIGLVAGIGLVLLRNANRVERIYAFFMGESKILSDTAEDVKRFHERAEK